MRTHLLKLGTIALLFVSQHFVRAQAPHATSIPVVFDTDIGDDIDDTWALALLLKSPELDLQLVTTTCGKAEYRAKLVARLLTIAGRSDIPIGLGAGGRSGDGGQQEWVREYKLQDYAGKVHQDGVQTLIDLIKKSPKTITIISVGPSHTVAAALEREPALAAKAEFVGMQGSVRKGYNGGAPAPEYNVKENVPAAQRALQAPWKRAVITPLDTCGLVKLAGARFESLKHSDDPLVKAVLQNYQIWAKKNSLDQSSILFDTVAVYLACPGPKPLLTLEDIKIKVDDAGSTIETPNGVPFAVATVWQNLDGYEDWMVNRLLHEPVHR